MRLRRIGTQFDRVRVDLNTNSEDIEREFGRVNKRIADQLTQVPQPSEVIDARNGEPSLSIRLEKDKDETAIDIAQVSQRLDEKKMDKNTTDIGFSQINKNKGLLDETYFTDEVKQQWAGNTPIHSVPAKRSITNDRMAEKAITPEITSFARLGKNKFNGIYVNGNPSGVDNPTWNDSQAKSAIVKVEQNKRYVVSKSNDTDRFRIYSSKAYPKNGDVITHRLIIDNETSTAVLSNDDNYLIIYVSSPTESKEPDWMQVEEQASGGGTPYEPAKVIMDFEENSIETNSVKNIMPVGTLYGSDDAFDVSLKNKEITTTSSGGFVLVGDTTYQLKTGVWTYENYTASWSVAICFDMETRDITFLPHGEIVKNKNLAFLGTIRRNRDVYQLNGLHTLEGEKISNNPSEDGTAPNFIITDIARNFEADDYTDLPTDSELDVDYVYGEFDSLVLNYPEYVSKELGTHDVTGLPIYEYHFKPPKAQGEVSFDLPKIYVQSGIHGHEWGCVLTTILFFKELCENWTNKDALRLFRFNAHFVVVPLLNPWGRNHKAAGGNGIEARKNANGVDLARNFPSGWTYVSDKDSMYYAGEEPMSELETQYAVNFMENNGDIIFALDLHNFGNYPEDRTYAFWTGSRDEKVQKLLTGVGNQVTADLVKGGIVDSSSLSRITQTQPASTSYEWVSRKNKAALVEFPYSIGGVSAQKQNVSALGNLILGFLMKYDAIR